MLCTAERGIAVSSRCHLRIHASIYKATGEKSDDGGKSEDNDSDNCSSYTGWAKKVNPICSTRCYNLQKICNALVINYSTTPQMRRHTTL